MRTWVKASLAGVSLVVLGIAALAGTSAYFVFRNLDRRSATETETLRELDAIRARFGPRQPLVELTNPQSGDIRINRLVHPEGRRASTLHVVTWNADDGELPADGSAGLVDAVQLDQRALDAGRRS
jgi:hypothetical protein